MDLQLVTIITATFNSEKTIANCINSVLNQSYKYIEYILIDAGSKDRTVEIIKSFELLFEGRLKWISESDNGIYDAWNKGIKMASGEWYSFIGSDDILMKDAIWDYIETINSDNRINFMSSNALQVTEKLEPLRKVGKPWSDEMLTHCCVSHVGSMHHKSLFAEHGLFNTSYKIAADYDFLLRCFNDIKPSYFSKISAYTKIGGISDRKIFCVAGEVLKIKINNSCKPVLICYVDFCITVVKFYTRSFINALSLYNYRN